MRIRIALDGRQREFTLHVPAGWLSYATELGSGLPLVLALHGAGQRIEAFRDQWSFDDEAAKSGVPVEDRFFVLYIGGVEFSPVETGFGVDFAGPTDVDDLMFVQAAVAEAERRLRFGLQRAGLPYGNVFDPERIYAFGYSQGGMLAYKLAAAQTLDLAAIWVFAGCHGGRYAYGVTKTVVHLPPAGALLSVFHHHGLLDTVVDPNGRPLALNQAIVVVLQLGGFSQVDAERYANAALNPFDAVLGIVQQWGIVTAPTYHDAPGFEAGTLRDVTIWNPVGTDNPQARLVLDPGIDHTHFTDPGPTQTRYWNADRVWVWFKNHPHA